MKIIYLLILLPFSTFISAQYDFEPSADHPYGLPNPQAPKELMDFAPLIGICNCTSEVRNQDQSWSEPQDMMWKFKYIMNGMAIQDETLKADGSHSGSIRQFISDSARWYVHYYSSGTPTATLPTWEGSKTEDDKIVLYRDQKAPNGMDGSFRLSFYDIDPSGFKWIGEWVDTSESIVYPTWRIDCTKEQSAASDEAEIDRVVAASRGFSKAFIAQDLEAMAISYTHDAKFIPSGVPIIEGREAIKARWIPGFETKVLSHIMEATEIKILGDYAYDYGYYRGTSKKGDGPISSWQGKYVVVWKKVDGDWQMYIDIWNSLDP